MKFFSKRYPIFVIAALIFVVMGAHLLGAYIYSNGKYQ